jgi:hypothetical protein
MRVGAAVLTLTLAVGLGAVGVASGEESGNWLSRWFTPANVKDESEKSVEAREAADKAAKLAAIRRASRIAKQAEADWLRRSDVCDKIRAIADSTGDDALRQKADRLDQRSWEIYLAAKKSSAPAEPSEPEPTAKKGSRK